MLLLRKGRNGRGSQEDGREKRNGMRKEFRSRNAPLGLQEHQKGILPKRNRTERNAGIPQNRGSRIVGTKKECTT